MSRGKWPLVYPEKAWYTDYKVWYSASIQFAFSTSNCCRVPDDLIWPAFPPFSVPPVLHHLYFWRGPEVYT